VAAKSGQFTAGEIEKGQFLRRNRRNLAGEGVVRKISSPRRVTGVPTFCINLGHRVGNLGKGGCCSGFFKQVRQFITGKSSVTGDPL